METKIITDNHRESLTIEREEGKIYGFRVIQETKAQFPNYPTRRAIILTIKEAQEVAQFIQNNIKEVASIGEND